MNNTTLSPTYEPKASIHDMGIVFKLNAPQDLSYMATALTPLVSMGVLSKRTAMENLLIVANPDQEEERIATEQEQQAQYNRATFESDTFPGMTDESETDTAE
jgi:phage gp29-like protein